MLLLLRDIVDCFRLLVGNLRKPYSCILLIVTREVQQLQLLPPQPCLHLDPQSREHQYHLRTLKAQVSQTGSSSASVQPKPVDGYYSQSCYTIYSIFCILWSFITFTAVQYKSCYKQTTLMFIQLSYFSIRH